MTVPSFNRRTKTRGEANQRGRENKKGEKKVSRESEASAAHRRLGLPRSEMDLVAVSIRTSGLVYDSGLPLLRFAETSEYET